ncbi:MAG: hypothetical protein KY450_03200 [Actinobacteria bacterium]|nr:hypothetical protein [Actinomycetota bacterium]
MFTLVICLVVVGLSGAAVVHILFSDAPSVPRWAGPPAAPAGTAHWRRRPTVAERDRRWP